MNRLRCQHPVKRVFVGSREMPSTQGVLGGDGEKLIVRLRPIHPQPSPKKMASARFTDINVCVSSRPNASPAFSRGIVCALSTMICEVVRSPFPMVGSTRMRKVSIDRNSLVTGKTITDG